MTTYYADENTGDNDDDGLSTGNAFATIEYAQTQMQGGDVLRLLSGSWTETARWTTSGSSGNVITIEANNTSDPPSWNGSRPFGSGNYQPFLLFEDCEYVTVRYLDMTSSIGRGITINRCDNITVENVNTSDMWEDGLTSLHSSFTTFTNCTTDLCMQKWLETGVQGGQSLHVRGGQSCVIDGCTSSNGGGEGISVGQVWEIQIVDCVSLNHHHEPIYVNNFQTLGNFATSTATGCYIDGCVAIYDQDQRFWTGATGQKTPGRACIGIRCETAANISPEVTEFPMRNNNLLITNNFMMGGKFCLRIGKTQFENEGDLVGAVVAFNTMVNGQGDDDAPVYGGVFFERSNSGFPSNCIFTGNIVVQPSGQGQIMRQRPGTVQAGWTLSYNVYSRPPAPEFVGTGDGSTVDMVAPNASYTIDTYSLTNYHVANTSDGIDIRSSRITATWGGQVISIDVTTDIDDNGRGTNVSTDAGCFDGGGGTVATPTGEGLFVIEGSLDSGKAVNDTQTWTNPDISSTVQAVLIEFVAVPIEDGDLKVDGVAYSIGMASGTGNQGCYAGHAEDASPDTVSKEMLRSNRICYLWDDAGTKRAEMELAGFVAGGFTLKYTSVASGNYIFRATCITGAEAVAVGTDTITGTEDVAQNLTQLGDQANCAIALVANRQPSTTASSGNSIQMSFGAWVDGGNQAHFAWTNVNGNPSGTVRAIMSNAYVGEWSGAGASLMDLEAGTHASGWSITPRNNAGSGFQGILHMAIKWPSSLNVEVGIADVPGSTGDNTIGTGAADFALFVTSLLTAENTVATNDDAGGWSMGVMTADDAWSIGFSEDDGAGTTNNSMQVSGNPIYQLNHVQSVDYVAAASEFPGGGGAEVTYSDVTGAGSKIMYFIVENPAAPNPPIIASVTADQTNITEGTEVDFTYSVSSGTTPYTYSLDTGDGDTETGLDPSHTYSTAGVYSVTLVVTDDNGETDTYTLDDYITVTVVTDDVDETYHGGSDYDTHKIKPNSEVFSITPDSRFVHFGINDDGGSVSIDILGKDGKKYRIVAVEVTE